MTGQGLLLIGVSIGITAAIGMALWLLALPWGVWT